MEDFRVDYIRSLQNVINTFDLSEKDRGNLCGCVGALFYQICQSKGMTIELAKELDLEHMIGLIGKSND